ncbi:acyltransferase [Hymenobacter sp. BT186]|uniref:Acyltransferase n=1 Tax=Hymenobacter telluris TaxID=2816474 RepID=A0A939EZ08_9BACT|nr:acyltransferase [Hymenobacter telluris]MBO0359794.1 acyltransferase [Hymenobacter telluris]MBW3375821.1 acyltransferase [Hymenobacter norwichensis]
MKNELLALTGLRGVAALLVFWFHVDLRTPLTFLWQFGPLYNVFSHGAFGVTIFFVLSGFVLTYSQLRTITAAGHPSVGSYAAFMRKRFARIYPVYLVGMLLTALVCTVQHSWPPDMGVLAVTNLTMTQVLFPSISMLWYSNGAWSVAVEVFFYLVFPFLLPLLLRIRRQAVLWVVLAVVVLVGTLGGAAYTLWPEHVSYVLMYSHPLFRVSEFVSGVVAGILVFRFNWRPAEWKALLIVALAVGYIVFFGSKLLGFVVHNWLVVPAVVVLLAVAVQPEKTKVVKLLAHPWLVYAGRISYCFYVVQLPLFMAEETLLERQQLAPGQQWYGFPIFCVTLLLAVVVHKWVEQPAYRFLTRTR